MYHIHLYILQYIHIICSTHVESMPSRQHVMCPFFTQAVSIRTSGVAFPIALSSVPGNPSEAWHIGQWGVGVSYVGTSTKKNNDPEPLSKEFQECRSFHPLVLLYSPLSRLRDHAMGARNKGSWQLSLHIHPHAQTRQHIQMLLSVNIEYVVIKDSKGHN